MAVTRTLDLTGTRSAALKREVEEESVRSREEAYARAAEEAAAASNDVIDLVKPVVPEIVDDTEIIDDGPVEVRVAEDIQQMTVGKKTYDFVRGRKYRVEKNVADVLRWGGKLYDRL